MFGSVELLGNQPAVPGQDGIRERGGGDQLKVFSAKPFAALSQSGALWMDRRNRRW